MDTYNELVGEVLTHIDENADNGEILLTTESGRQFKIYHYQDCCESVYIEGTDGDWNQLLNKKLIAVDCDYEDGGDKEAYDSSSTRTIFTFKVNDATVINKWFGSSNGYYSETASLEEITKKGQNS